MRTNRYLVLSVLLALVLASAASSQSAPENLAEHRAVADAITLLDIWIEEQRTYEDVPGLSIGVVHDGTLIWAQGYGVADLETGTPATPQTLYRIASITKTFTSTAVMQLRDAGLLRLDDPVKVYLPWFEIRSAFDDAPEITVRHLLTHTAGLPREAAFPYWTDHEFPSREEMRAALREQDAVFAPETRAKYSNLGMALLGEVVAAVSGMSYEDCVREKIFEPLGMTSSTAAPTPEHRARMTTGYYRKTAGGRRVAEYYETRALVSAANIVSSVEDMALYAALHLAGGDVLKTSTVREMQRVHWVYPSWQGGRGLGFGIARRDGKTFVEHGGWVAGNRSHLLLDPDADIAVVVMTNADDASPSNYAYETYDVLAPAIAKATAVPSEEKVADPSWQRYVGKYADPWGWEYTVLIRGGELVFYEHNFPPDDAVDSLTVLTPVAEHTFRMSDGENVVFELDDEGNVERVRRRYDYIFPVER